MNEPQTNKNDKIFILACDKIGEPQINANEFREFRKTKNHFPEGQISLIIDNFS